MKKKLLLSVLAAGLVLPTASALAQNGEFHNPNLSKEANDFVNNVVPTTPAPEQPSPKDVSLAENTKPTESGTKLAPGLTVGDSTGKKEIVINSGVEKTIAANKDVKKPEMDKKPVAPTTNKAANKAGMKKLPKTSAVK